MEGVEHRDARGPPDPETPLARATSDAPPRRRIRFI